MLNASCNGKLADEADQRLMLAHAKAVQGVLRSRVSSCNASSCVAAAMAEMLRLTEQGASSMPDNAAKKALLGKAVRGDELGAQLLGATRVLAPTIVDSDCQVCVSVLA
jgi:hypothetical protein